MPIVLQCDAVKEGSNGRNRTRCPNKAIVTIKKNSFCHLHKSGNCELYASARNNQVMEHLTGTTTTTTSRKSKTKASASTSASASSKSRVSRSREKLRDEEEKEVEPHLVFGEQKEQKQQQKSDNNNISKKIPSWSSHPISVELTECADQGKEMTYMEDKLASYHMNIKNPWCNGKCTISIVCDGHGGARAAEWFTNHFQKIVCSKLNLCEKLPDGRRGDFKYDVPMALKKAVQQASEDWDEYGKQYVKEHPEKCDPYALERGTITDGCTLLAAFIHHDSGTTWLINVGDSRGVCMRDGKVILATIDHKPGNREEMKRISKRSTDLKKKSNGKKSAFVTRVKGGIARLNGILGMSRSMGDNHEELEGAIDRECDIYEIQCDKELTICLGTDGVYDIMSNAEIAKQLYSNPNAGAEEIIAHGLAKPRVRDNLSCIVLRLRAE